MDFLCLCLWLLGLILCLVYLRLVAVGCLCVWLDCVYSSWCSFTYFGLFVLVLLGLTLCLFGCCLRWLNAMLIVLIFLFFGCVLSMLVGLQRCVLISLVWVVFKLVAFAVVFGLLTCACVCWVKVVDLVCS